MKRPGDTPLLTLLISVVLITLKVASHIVNPLYLDALRPDTSSTTNSNVTGVTNDTNNNATLPHFNTNPFLILLVEDLVVLVLTAIVLVVLIICRPGKIITSQERNYPKIDIFASGATHSLSSTLANYSSSGTRTPPYLQSLLLNFKIPIQFVIRFAILRRRPTCWKALCASIVLAAEFASLLPSIFPSLESSKDHKEDGGATGVGRIIWPIIYASSLIPSSLDATFTEKVVNRRHDTDASLTQNRRGNVNLFYFLFWYTVFNAAAQALLFWVDVIPGFGTSTDFSNFYQSAVYNLGILFGTNSNPLAALLGWLKILLHIGHIYGNCTLVRYSEGSNFASVISSLESPLVLLVWTLCLEHPFTWRPHADLSTWLGVASLCVMIPTIVLYNKQINCSKLTAFNKANRKTMQPASINADRDQKPLLQEEHTFEDSTNHKQYSKTKT